MGAFDLLLLLLLFIILSCSSSSSSSSSISALIAFKQSSVSSDPNGFLNNWNASSNGSPCSWTGVLCSGGEVVGLNLSGMALSGKLELRALMALPKLQNLSLHGNHFHGDLSFTPISSSSLSCNLETLDISSNNLSATISGEFLALCPRLVSLNLSMNSISGGVYPFGSSLQVLDLSRNRINDNGLLNHSLFGCHGLSFLNFSGNKLTGGFTGVSPCSKLTVLDLSYNLISGGIPPEFITASFELLDFSHNNFSGELSALDFQSCDNLQSLNLSSNAFNGSGLPESLSNCRKLEKLDFTGNHISGGIPSSSLWKNLTNLKILSLANNKFSGEIPAELSHACNSLIELDLSGNMLTGELPSSFISCSSIQSLNLGHNQLSGRFIESVVSTMSSLKVLLLPFNNISGTVPLLSLTNCSLLQVIDLGSNEFTGEIPSGLCSSIPRLEKLSLPNNFISGALPPGLGNCSNLKRIDLSLNELNGVIPLEIWRLPKLVDLVLWANNFSGEIPADALCSNSDSTLQSLILSFNKLNGSIPRSFTRCLNLVWVSLSFNELTGEIPDGISNLQNLAILQLSINSLSGEIPRELGDCKNLIWLDLYSNKFTGSIPSSLALQSGRLTPGIVSGKQFAFLRNEAGNICAGAGVLFEFEGIRQERLAEFALVHSCQTMRIYTGMTVYSYTSNGSMIYLDLSYNSLSGNIPENFGTMKYLQVLNLAHNELTGVIPEALGGMKMALELDLSNNHLTGEIPATLGTLTFLTDLDVSNNNLTGLIPMAGQLTTFPASRFANNSGLCGVPLSPCTSHQISNGSNSYSRGGSRLFVGSVLIGILISLLVVMMIMLAFYKLKKQWQWQWQWQSEGHSEYVESLPTSSGTTSWKLSGVLEPLSINVATFENPLRKLTFAHLLDATNGFSAESLIGSGGFGEVYKAKLKDGTVVAIKKLIHVTGQGDREFTAEMETIGKFKHRNLVPLLGYCNVGDERLLVYEYMKFGSLDVVLHDRTKGAIDLDWSARKKIAIGSARGLAFLHHSCSPHIIHRDMKSSNVLLDENLEARVSDFGMARLMNAVDTHLSVTTLAGTPGYVPPEYYQSFRCTTKGDVYSYGVVLLELLSGKKPIDPLEFGDNNLVGWVKQMVKENTSSEIFDPVLMSGSNSAENELYQYLKIACECLDDRPLRRPTMIQVMSMLNDLKTDTDSDTLIDIDESKGKR